MTTTTSNYLHISLEQYNHKLPLTQREGETRVRGIPTRKNDPDKPLVSIITVVLNCRQHIEQALTSVLDQTYPNIEYIIIDGGSTDGTLDIIRSYDDRIAYWMSEQDLGISDAFNKGIAASTGEIIGILNADDWMSRDQVERGVEALTNSSADFVFGDMLIHDVDGAAKCRIRGNPQYEKIITSKMPELNHPTVLAYRRAYEAVGGCDTSYKYAMDYDWMLRLHLAGGKGLYVSELTGHMRESGVSDRLFIQSLDEVRRIAIRYGQPRVIANTLFVYRALKGHIRRMMEQRLPRPLYHYFRNLVNPRYSPSK